MSLNSLSVLLRWLGPWANSEKTPDAIYREEVVLPGSPSKAYSYHNQLHAPLGAYLVVSGLHMLGPDEPRLDRFCRILAQAGFLVLSPFLPDHMNLLISPKATRDLGHAWDYLEARAFDEK